MSVMMNSHRLNLKVSSSNVNQARNWIRSQLLPVQISSQLDKFVLASGAIVKFSNENVIVEYNNSQPSHQDSVTKIKKFVTQQLQGQVV